jgi:AcrR family transcriptional regulator
VRAPILPAKQARSRATRERLLKATAELLEEGGLEAATLPRIAARARLSPATVYRRFPDKDALLQEVFRRFFEKIYQWSQENFRREMWEGLPLAEMARRVFATMIERNRQHAGLMLALMRYVARHPQAGFKRQAQEQQLRSFQNVTRLFLARREEIGHPEPTVALQLGLLAVSAVMRDLMLIRKAKPEVAQVFPLSDEKIQDELLRLFLRYLGVEEPDARV